MIDVINEKSFTATQIITTTDSDGKTIEIASLYGAVELDRMTSYNFTILNADIYDEHKQEIQDIVDKFKAEITAKIDEMGGLQF